MLTLVLHKDVRVLSNSLKLHWNIQVLQSPNNSKQVIANGRGRTDSVSTTDGQQVSGTQMLLQFVQEIFFQLSDSPRKTQSIKHSLKETKSTLQRNAAGKGKFIKSLSDVIYMAFPCKCARMWRMVKKKKPNCGT